MVSLNSLHGKLLILRFQDFFDEIQRTEVCSLRQENPDNELRFGISQSRASRRGQSHLHLLEVCGARIWR